MRGEFIDVWSETWREIWSGLALQKTAPSDLFCELYEELISALKVKPSVQQIAEITNDPDRSEESFANTKSEDFSSEWALIGFLESAHEILNDLGGDLLATHYSNLLEKFIEKFNLRYDLKRSCTFCPTLPGIFTSLIVNLQEVSNDDSKLYNLMVECENEIRGLREPLTFHPTLPGVFTSLVLKLEEIASQNAHLDILMKEFEDSIHDLRIDFSEGRIKTCIQKQVNLLEAMGINYPGVKNDTLGAICNEINTWPNENVKAALKKVYKFTCEYPGLRHSGKPQRAMRAIDMRDMIAMSILLIGFTPYLTDQLDAETVYLGR